MMSFNNYQIVRILYGHVERIKEITSKNQTSTISNIRRCAFFDKELSSKAQDLVSKLIELTFALRELIVILKVG